MLTKSVTYTDYNGTERTDEWYFNLNKIEIIKLQNAFPGGLDKEINRIIDNQDNAALFNMFEKLVLESVGKKSEDGRKFIKNEEIKEDFMQSGAYEELMFTLITDEKEATAFVNGIIPVIPEAQTANAAITFNK